MTSTATCVIAGRVVNVNSYKDVSDADPISLLQENKKEMYYAIGNAWTVFTEDESLLQMQLTNDAAGLLKAGVADSTAPAADIPGEESTAQAVVDSIGGTVEHFTP
jgi:hypothetical protein